MCQNSWNNSRSKIRIHFFETWWVVNFNFFTCITVYIFSYFHQKIKFYDIARKDQKHCKFTLLVAKKYWMHGYFLGVLLHIITWEKSECLVSKLVICRSTSACSVSYWKWVWRIIDVMNWRSVTDRLTGHEKDEPVK